MPVINTTEKGKNALKEIVKSYQHAGWNCCVVERTATRTGRGGYSGGGDMVVFGAKIDLLASSPDGRTRYIQVISTKHGGRPHTHKHYKELSDRGFEVFQYHRQDGSGARRPFWTEYNYFFYTRGYTGTRRTLMRTQKTPHYNFIRLAL